MYENKQTKQSIKEKMEWIMLKKWVINYGVYELSKLDPNSINQFNQIQTLRSNKLKLKKEETKEMKVLN